MMQSFKEIEESVKEKMEFFCFFRGGGGACRGDKCLREKEVWGAGDGELEGERGVGC